jgi:hypothetical protein
LLVVSQTLFTKEKAWVATWFGSRAPELEARGLYPGSDPMPCIFPEEEGGG